MALPFEVGPRAEPSSQLVERVVDLQVADVEIDECKGKLRVRAHKGSKARTLPMDNKTCQALQQYKAGVREKHRLKESGCFLMITSPGQAKGRRSLVRMVGSVFCMQRYRPSGPGQSRAGAHSWLLCLESERCP
jgi:integrase